MTPSRHSPTSKRRSSDGRRHRFHEHPHRHRQRDPLPGGRCTTYKPREMAAAVAALDGTDAGQYQEQPYMALESGVLPESVFSDIASAIRGQNGESTLYTPGDMAAAILALEWTWATRSVRCFWMTEPWRSTTTSGERRSPAGASCRSSRSTRRATRLRARGRTTRSSCW